MKSIEFDEDQLKNLQELGAQLFCDQNDPCSYGYQRALIRPVIRWWRIILYCVIALLLTSGVFFLLWIISSKSVLSLVIALLFALTCLLMHTKQIIICLVRIYQRYAPAHIRNKCRFEPSCSQYMILALEKYGLRKGLPKGIDRLKRCNIHDGGYDEP